MSRSNDQMNTHELLRAQLADLNFCDTRMPCPQLISCHRIFERVRFRDSRSVGGGRVRQHASGRPRIGTGTAGRREAGDQQPHGERGKGVGDAESVDLRVGRSFDSVVTLSTAERSVRHAGLAYQSRRWARWREILTAQGILEHLGSQPRRCPGRWLSGTSQEPNSRRGHTVILRAAALRLPSSAAIRDLRHWARSRSG